MAEVAKDGPIVEWTTDNEIHLFYAMKGYKPVGINRFFRMICIQETFCNLIRKDVPSRVIWDHLDELYDMEALHENDDLPFANVEVDFKLPSEFDELMEEKIAPPTDSKAEMNVVTAATTPVSKKQKKEQKSSEKLTPGRVVKHMKTSSTAT